MSSPGTSVPRSRKSSATNVCTTRAGVAPSTPPLVIRNAVPGLTTKNDEGSIGPPVVSSMTQCAAVNSTVGFHTPALQIP